MNREDVSHLVKMTAKGPPLLGFAAMMWFDQRGQDLEKDSASTFGSMVLSSRQWGTGEGGPNHSAGSPSPQPWESWLLASREKVCQDCE